MDNNDDIIYNEYEQWILKQPIADIISHYDDIEININTTPKVLFLLRKKCGITKQINMKFDNYSDYECYMNLFNINNTLNKYIFIKSFNNTITIDEILSGKNSDINEYKTFIWSIKITYDHFLLYKKSIFNKVDNNFFVNYNPNCLVKYFNLQESIEDASVFNGIDPECETFIIYNIERFKNTTVLKNKNITYDFFLKYYYLFPYKYRHYIEKKSSLTIDNVMHYLDNYYMFYYGETEDMHFTHAYEYIFKYANITLTDIINVKLLEHKHFTNFIKYNKNFTINDSLKLCNIYNYDIYKCKHSYHTKI